MKALIKSIAIALTAALLATAASAHDNRGHRHSHGGGLTEQQRFDRGMAVMGAFLGFVENMQRNRRPRSRVIIVEPYDYQPRRYRHETWRPRQGWRNRNRYCRRSMRPGTCNPYRSH